MRHPMLGLAAAAMLASSPGHAQSVRAPFANWVLASGSTQCVASRQYGTPDNPLELELKLAPLGKAVRVLLVRKASGGPFSKFPVAIEGKIRVDGGAPLPMSMLAYDLKSRGERILLAYVPFETFAVVRRGELLSIDAPNVLRTQLKLSSVEPVMRALEACAERLRREWNGTTEADPDPKVKQGASGNLQRAFKASDYPAAAVRGFATGTAKFVILIDEAGRVADCSIVKPSGVAILDVQSSAIVKERVRFTPAVGFDGRPARDIYVQQVTWALR